jgi:hypothetical protein
MTVEAREKVDGLFKRVLFRFDVPLEDPSLRWVTWDAAKNGWADYHPPPIGGRAVVNPATN